MLMPKPAPIGSEVPPVRNRRRVTFLSNYRPRKQ
jgi:hypothetical protein